MATRSTPRRFSRRRLLAGSSAGLAVASPLVLAACGSAEEDEDTDPAREAEVLNEVLAAQLATGQVLIETAKAADEGLRTHVDFLQGRRDESTAAIEAFVGELGGEAVTEPAPFQDAESAVEAAARQLEAAISTSLDAIGEITTGAYRQAVHRAITEDAALLALVRDVLGEDPSPDAFVLGPPGDQGEGE